MKKMLFLIAMLFAVNCVKADTLEFLSENFVTETVDEFGEKTGDKKVGILAKGYFSNDATTNSCAMLQISIMEKGSRIDLYEYCSDHPSRNNFFITFIGENGEKVKCYKWFTPGKNTLPKFLAMCKNNDVIKVKIMDLDDYLMSAVFKLYDMQDFYNKVAAEFPEKIK